MLPHHHHLSQLSHPLLRLQVLVTGPDCHGKGMASYQEYLHHLYTTRGEQSEYERFSQGYEELLQIPLQPLKDNLDNSTYEVSAGERVS